MGQKGNGSRYCIITQAAALPLSDVDRKRGGFLEFSFE
jgi:hypothetical protein